MSGRGGGGGSGVGGGGGGTTGEGVSGKKGLPGVKSFSPTEQELVGYYLKKQIEGKDSEFRDIIPVIDHVCKREPRDLPAVFFSKPDYKNSKRDRCNRTTDEGKYKITCRDREIKDELSKTVIGKKRYLAFKDHVPSAKKTKYVIHEYSLTKAELAKLGVGPNPNQKKEFVLCCLKSKSANSKKLKDVSICGNELAEPAIGGEIASNSEDDQAAATGMIQGPDEHLLKEPSCADLGVQQLAATSATTPTSATSFGGVGVGSPDGFLWSDFDDLLEEPFWADQPHQPPPPSQPQNYCSSTLPSALCTKQGNVPSLYNDDCSKQLSATGNNISTNYHYEPVSNTAYSVQNGATDERFSEVYKISTNDHDESVSSEAYLQPEENLGIPSSISATGLYTAVAKEHRTGRCYACQ